MQVYSLPLHVPPPILFFTIQPCSPRHQRLPHLHHPPKFVSVGQFPKRPVSSHQLSACFLINFLGLPKISPTCKLLPVEHLLAAKLTISAPSGRRRNPCTASSVCHADKVEGPVGPGVLINHFEQLQASGCRVLVESQRSSRFIGIPLPTRTPCTCP